MGGIRRIGSPFNCFTGTAGTLARNCDGKPYQTVILAAWFRNLSHGKITRFAGIRKVVSREV